MAYANEISMANAGKWYNRFPAGSGWKSIIFLCCLIMGIRFLSSGIMGMMPQDAYYDFYAQHLALSYYDHPPMIAYILRLFTTLFGKKVFVLKLADTTVTLLTVLHFINWQKNFSPGINPGKPLPCWFPRL